jgi:hypothetical protein
MGAIFLLALLLLVAGRAVPAMARAIGTPPDGDRPARLLARAVRGLPGDRAGWGTAMVAELGQVGVARERWRFSLGCVRVALALRAGAALARRDRGAGALRAAMLLAVAAAFALAADGLVRYPGLRSGAAAWGASAFLTLLLICYAAAALTLLRGATRQVAAARRYGATGGVVVGAAWFAILAPPHALKAWVFVPLLAALVVPAAAGALAGRASRDARAATGAALWSGLVGGLLVFLVWVAETYARDGGPYDAQLLRDFRRSGSHDLVAYAVSDNVGAAIGLLVIIPTVAVAVGSLVGRAAARR